MTVTPETAMLVIIDMQNDFCHELGVVTQRGEDTERVRAIVSSIREMLSLASEYGVPRVFVRSAHSQWFDSASWEGRPSISRAQKAGLGAVSAVREGTWGAEFYGIAPEEDDLVLTKHRYSAFAYTPLELALQAKNKTTVLLAGTQTNVCVIASAVDALSRGFSPVLMRDCVATPSPEHEASALQHFERHLGVSTTVGELASSWRSHAVGS